MELNEAQLIALVNSLVDSIYPNPEDPGPVGPWGPWIREALKQQGPWPEPWNGPQPDPWQSPSLYGRAAITALARLVGQVDDHGNPFGGRQPRPNWNIIALLNALASLNPQPLPPVNPDIRFARSLATVALQQAHQAGGEQGGNLLFRFGEDWCGTLILIPFRPKPGEPSEPRPPRPQESLVLGAQLVRASSSVESVAVKKAAEEVGHKIFAYGLAGPA